MPRIGNWASYKTKPSDSAASEPGFVHQALDTREIAEVWNEFRLRASTATLLAIAALAVAWGWPGGYVLSFIALVSIVDAYARREGTQRMSVATSVALDLTLIGVGIMVADLQPLAIAAPYLYMLAMPLLLLPIKRALVLMAYATAWAVISQVTSVSGLAPPVTVDTDLVPLMAFLIFGTLLLFLIGVVAISLANSRKATQRRLSVESALTKAGQRLLAESGESALVEVLEDVRQALGARAVFVAENKGDQKAGPAAMVRQVCLEGDDTEPTLTRWTLPYMQHQEVAAALARGEAARLDGALRAITGSTDMVALCIPVFIGGEWSGFLGVAHDTKHGEAPEPDHHILESVAVMLGAFFERQAAHSQLEQMIKSKDQFLASVSHEIRTPLTSVLGFASVLKEDIDSLTGEEGQEIVELIERQALEVSDLIEDLLVAARAEIDAIHVIKEPLSLGDEINNVISARLGEEQSDIFVAASPHHRAVADPTRVRQIIRNLLTNALRYGGDQITITTHRDGPEVIIVFSDNGDGIPPDLRKRIFDPYERGNSARVKPESIGLGLAVSRQLARLMDGDLTLRRDLGGATFQLSLPMAPMEDDPDGDGLPEGAVVLGSEVHITVAASEWN